MDHKLTEKQIGFRNADILLPDFDTVDAARWAVVACDQYTSEPAYWQSVEALVGGAPSTLHMILPEVYLEETSRRVPLINQAMQEMLERVLRIHTSAMIALARTQSDGSIRRGLIGAIDLERYDYRKGSDSLIRATEGTVLERIPPRVTIRRDAPLELPHVMLLIDDPARTVIEPIAAATDARVPLYDFDLMADGGHVTAHLLTDAEQERVCCALADLVTPEAMEARYHMPDLAPLLFAVGDGNHSLATAKECYEIVKRELGEEMARKHPARYALCEIVNLHDDALSFEPIYRVVFGADVEDLMRELASTIEALDGTADAQELLAISRDWERTLTVARPEQQLAVGTLQSFLSDYTARHPEVTVDYIHGEDSLRALAKQEGAVGFLFEGMRKDELFRTVIFDGALPRKTFSMGHAQDKRYYLECRKIR